MKPGARRNGRYGYKPMVIFNDNVCYYPMTAVFPSRSRAIEAATEWMTQNLALCEQMENHPDKRPRKHYEIIDNQQK